jgi:putative DNA primase/helicase
MVLRSIIRATTTAVNGARPALAENGRVAPDTLVCPLTRAEGRTDVANAARLLARYGEDLRWVGPWKCWLIWDGKRWRPDRSLAVERKAKGVAKALWRELATALRDQTPDKDTLKAMYAHAKHASSNKGIADMVALARCERPIDVEALDADPWLLNVSNGTLDLRTGELRGHRKEDYLTKLAPVAYDPDATCPRWLEFLDRIFAGDYHLIAYLRRLVGYSLTGVVRQHLLPFMHGLGANGKTTFIETLLNLLGPDYSMKAAPDLLLARRNDSHPTERADLFGKRLVACVEVEEGRRLAEALVKEMTGGDRMRARRMREDFWEFVPRHHVWLAGNHRPTVTGTDIGIWRRIKLIPFEVTIPLAEQDLELTDKLRAELPGILNWALTGCWAWNTHGMREPAAVRLATAEYAAEQDDVGRFIDENCVVGARHLVGATELFRAFKWAFPASTLTQQDFGCQLSQKGFPGKDPRTGKPHRTNTGKHARKGLRLRVY